MTLLVTNHDVACYLFADFIREIRPSTPTPTPTGGGGGKGSVVPLTLHTDPALKISSPGSKTRGIRSEPRFNLHKRLCGVGGPPSQQEHVHLEELGAVVVGDDGLLGDL